MCENNSIMFIMRVGIEEYSRVEVYFEAIKYINLPIIPQIKMNILNIDEIVNHFDISRVDYDIASKTYKVFDLESIERYCVMGSEGRMKWVDERIELYTTHGWSINKLKRYEEGIKAVKDEIKWKNRNIEW